MMYWRVKLPASMLAWGSEFLFSRLMTILALVLGSDSSASDCEGSVCGAFQRRPFSW